MSQRDAGGRRRPRPAFPATAWEALEGRQLLSAASASAAATAARSAKLAAAAEARWNAYAVRHDAQLARQAAKESTASNLAIPSTPATTTTTPGMTVPENSPTLTGVKFRAITLPTSSGYASVPGVFGTRTVVTPTAGVTPSNFLTAPTLHVTAATVAASPTASAVGTTAATTTAAALGTPTPASTTTTTTTTTPTSPAPAPPPLPQPLPFLTSAKLSIDQGQAMQTAVNNLANTYTYGKTPATDQAAVAAFESQLNAIAQSFWAAAHVATPAQVASLQKAVDGFAKTYTSGQTPATDSTAWASLQSALQTFYGALTNPSAGTAATTPPASPTPTPPPGGAGVGGDSGADALGPLFMGDTLTTDEMGALRNAFTMFLSSYSYGADPTGDQTAVATFQTALGTLETTHLQNSPPSTWPAQWSVGTGAATSATTTLTATANPVSASATTGTA